MSKNKRRRSERATPDLPITALPFVTASEQGRPYYWSVAPADAGPRGHIEAEALGQQYAVQYMQWLHAYPELVGMGTLGWITADIDFHDMQRTGYWIGFFSRIERFVFDAGTVN